MEEKKEIQNRGSNTSEIRREDKVRLPDSIIGKTGYKSIRRAIKRGHLSLFGPIAHRPFNNRANTCKRKGKNSRSINERKKKDYGEAKRRANAKSL